MASVERQRVKFTGKRTGLTSIALKGIGRVDAGETVEVNADEAERWTTKLPMSDGKLGADFSKVGGSFSIEKDEVSERVIRQREKMSADDDPEELTSANTELAHGVDEDGGTAESDAEEPAESADDS